MFTSASFSKACLAGALLVGLLGCDKVATEANYDEFLVRYFSFSADGADEISGQDFDTHGAAPTKDRFNTENSAMFFNKQGTETINWMEIKGGLNAPEGSMSVWVNICCLYKVNPLIVSQSGGSDPDYYIGFDEKGTLEARYKDKWQVYSNIKFNPGQWFHLALRWNDETRKMDLFVNGNGVISVDYEGDFADLADEGLFMLGKFTDASKTYFYHGKIDELRIYNKWLPYSEIKALYSK